MGPTERLAHFLARSRWDDLPAAVRQEAKRGLLNLAGCIIAGRKDSAVALVRSTFPHEDGLLDAAAATAHDYDDTHLPTVIHATPPVGAAVLSIARTQPVSGAELLHAFVLGMETSCRMGNAVMPGHYEHGWHITGTCGVFGAAAAAGRLLKLDERQMLNALGLAATQAAGLVEVLGSMARVLNAGFAARNGIAAARLAAAGFEGPREPIEGRRGFLNVFGGSKDLAALTRALGEEWAMMQVAYKPYPSGVVLHALIDAVLEHREALHAAQAITVRLNPLAVERADRPQPRNAIEARLSAQHAVAVALRYGRAGIEEFSDTAANDAELAAARRRVRVESDSTLDKMAALIVAGGRSIEARASRAMDDPKLEAKLRCLAGSRAGELLQTIASLDAMERVPELIPR